MRMWMIPPEYMCHKHLNGEHNEIHKHLPSLYRGISVKGRYERFAQIQLNALQSRHDLLAEYLNHKSPVEVDEYLIFKNYPQYYFVNVDITYNVLDLASRCADCRKLLQNIMPFLKGVSR